MPIGWSAGLLTPMALPKTFKRTCKLPLSNGSQSKDALERERQRFEKACQKLDEPSP
jgi:hypothetical protein